MSNYSFYRLLNQMSDKDEFKLLPEVLCVDELKATKDCTGNMAFVAMDGQTHELITILDDRRIEALKRHFMNYKREERLKVKYLVMDMNASYEQLIKRCFPKAQVVTDRFHVVQQLTRSFNQLRIKIMKNYETKSPEYRHMKYFWKHLLKDYDQLSEKPFYSHSFRKYTDSKSLVETIIAEDEALGLAWQNLQMAMTHFKRRDAVAFFGLIEELDKEELDEDFVKKYQFLLKKQASIKLAMTLPYSNGCLEGMNNKIKALKRAAFGFRTFRNFRKRVFLMNI
ncbi:transposase [Lactococcus termiticola]|uniref:Transposase n=1 Tax=Lactococcus termiticola TaxID=2169526 RepID=A0A2R5HHR7_9LACT|nr:transposase [Lactococcus termiticola]